MGDVENHIMLTSHSQGVDVINKTTFYNFTTSDVTDFKGSFSGWSKTVYPNGDLVFAKHEGEINPSQSTEGKPLVILKGKFDFTKGTGKFEGIKGSGTFAGMYLSETIYTYDWQATYTLEK